MSPHASVCEAPICADCGGESVVWYVGEPICGKGHTKCQQNQRKINKLVSKGAFRNRDAYFTAKELGKLQRITPTLKSRVAQKMSYKPYRASPKHPVPSPFQLV